MSEKTTIAIKKKIKEELNARKLYPRETAEEVLERLLNNSDRLLTLKEQEEKGI